MINDAFFVAAGLVIGWIFFPEPQWVANIYAAIKAKVAK